MWLVGEDCEPEHKRLTDKIRGFQVALSAAVVLSSSARTTSRSRGMFSSQSQSCYPSNGVSASLLPPPGALQLKMVFVIDAIGPLEMPVSIWALRM